MKDIQRVYLDLEKSIYFTEFEGLRYYFSSQFNLDRFLNNIEYFIKLETLKMINRYKVKANWNLLLTISYYKKIEKRGFRIETDDGEKINSYSIIFSKLKT